MEQEEEKESRGRKGRGNTTLSHQVSKVIRGLCLGTPCGDTLLDQHHHAMFKSFDASAMRAMSSEDTS